MNFKRMKLKGSKKYNVKASKPQSSIYDHYSHSIHIVFCYLVLFPDFLIFYLPLPFLIHRTPWESNLDILQVHSFTLSRITDGT